MGEGSAGDDPILDVRVEVDWSQFDREAEERERRLGSMQMRPGAAGTFGAETGGISGRSALGPGGVDMSRAQTAADRIARALEQQAEQAERYTGPAFTAVQTASGVRFRGPRGFIKATPEMWQEYNRQLGGGEGGGGGGGGSGEWRENPPERALALSRTIPAIFASQGSYAPGGGWSWGSSGRQVGTRRVYSGVEVGPAGYPELNEPFFEGSATRRQMPLLDGPTAYGPGSSAYGGTVNIPGGGGGGMGGGGGGGGR